MLRKFNFLVLLSVLVLSDTIGQNQQDFLIKSGIKDSVQSTILNEQRDFWVIVPDDIKDYDRLPVVYILDGDQQLENLHAVYSSYWGHHLPRMILVGIDNSHNRTRNLTISKVEQHWEENGEGEKFSLFIKEELIPLIEENYPVTTYRTLIGHSYGGLFTLNMMIHYPDLFQNYIAIDPSIDWDNQLITRELQKALKENDFSNKKLYLSLAGPFDRDNERATEDEVLQSNSPSSFFARSVLSFIYAAGKNSNGPDLHWDHFPDEIHGSVPLISMINGLKHQFQWYQLENLAEFNNPMTPASRIAELLDYRAEKLKQNFGYDVPAADAEMLIMGGEMFGQMGQPEKGLLFLEKGVEYYPKEEQMWIALAWYYENSGDKNAAINTLNKGLLQTNSDAIRDKIKALEDR